MFLLGKRRESIFVANYPIKKLINSDNNSYTTPSLILLHSLAKIRIRGSKCGGSEREKERERIIATRESTIINSRNFSRKYANRVHVGNL